MLSNKPIWASAIAGAAIVSAAWWATPARSARISFDGPWSILVVTDYGSCDRAYRYGVEIRSGRVFYAGNSAIDLSGTVTPGGRVTVRVRQGDQEAVGNGRLSEDSGGGNWSGASPDRQCGGHWTAERRG